MKALLGYGFDAWKLECVPRIASQQLQLQTLRSIFSLFRVF
eukprot:SAG31_NODE_26852_length_435_cov_1.053571_2_plen_40_part_01